VQIQASALIIVIHSKIFTSHINRNRNRIDERTGRGSALADLESICAGTLMDIYFLRIFHASEFNFLPFGPACC
jgi:hypothetical protein